MRLVSFAVPVGLLPLLFSSPTKACFAMPDPTNEALVDVGSSSFREPLYVVTYDRSEEGDGPCLAMLSLSPEDLPSRRLAPRPRELAESLVPVAKAFGAKTCEITVWLNEVVPADDLDPDACQRGTFRYDGGSWSTVEDDAPCW